MTREEYKALREKYRCRSDAEWRQRRREQMAKLAAYTIATILITGIIMASVWMGGMRYMP